MHFRRLSGSLIMNVKSELLNSKWRIQNGGQIFKKLMDFHVTWRMGILGSAITNQKSDFKKFTIADSIWRTNFEKVAEFS